MPARAAEAFGGRPHGALCANRVRVVALREIFESVVILDQPEHDRSAVARDRNSAATELGRILKADFDHALNAFAHESAQPAEHRALVRCFGSVIDGLASALLSMAEVCEVHWKIRSANRDDHGASILHRVASSHRILTRSLPYCPLRRLSGKRWDDLKSCVDLRNRVLHPETPADLEVSRASLRLMIEVAREFIHDFETFAQWHAARVAPQLHRKTHRGGRRFPKCPCGSGRKYKNCCAVAQLAA
jgi:hypothetical protein